MKKKADQKAEYVFPEWRKEYMRHAVYVTRPIQQFFESLGIKTTRASEGQRRNVVVVKGFHSLRHSFVSLCAMNDVPRATVMAIVGHNSAAVNDLYTHVGVEDMRRAITSLPAPIQ